MTRLSRRSLLGVGAGAVISGSIGWPTGVRSQPAQVAEAQGAERHGISAFGEEKKPA